MGLIAFKRLIREFGTNRRAAFRRSWPVGASIIVFVLYPAVGGNRIWLRYGVELRLLQAGGIKGVESWTNSHVAVLQTDWDKHGGLEGIKKLDDASGRRFFLVAPEEIPDQFKPLARYLPMHLITQGRDGRPAGIRFSLHGWDHGWGLTVDGDAPPEGELQSWPYRLSDRSCVWGKP